MRSAYDPKLRVCLLGQMLAYASSDIGLVGINAAIKRQWVMGSCESLTVTSYTTGFQVDIIPFSTAIFCPANFFPVLIPVILVQ